MLTTQLTDLHDRLVAEPITAHVDMSALDAEYVIGYALPNQHPGRNRDAMVISEDHK